VTWSAALEPVQLNKDAYDRSSDISQDASLS